MELAQRLRGRGVDARSLWTWCKIGEKWSVEWSYGDEPIKAERFAPAYTVSELGHMLPAVLDEEGTDSWLYIQKLEDVVLGGGWRVSYMDDEEVEHHIESKTEADARANMLVWLVEKHFIKPPKSNSPF